MRKLDMVDRKILLELDNNARITFSKIGKKLRIGKNNVQYRVKSLIKDGVIISFVTQFSIGNLGLFLGKIYMQIAGVTDQTRQEIYDYLIRDKRLNWVAECEGRWNLMIAGYIENVKQLDSIKRDFFRKYEEYVTAYDVVFVVEAYISKRNYLVPHSKIIKEIKKFIGLKKAVLDKYDSMVIHAIANDARFNYVDIAKKLKLNVKTVQKRVKDLEQKGVIQDYIMLIDLKKIGYNFFKICIFLQNYESRYEQFLKYCINHPNVIHVIESLGPWEIELEIEAERLQDFYDLVHEIRNQFASIIKRIDSVIIVNEMKLLFFPEWYC